MIWARGGEATLSRTIGVGPNPILSADFICMGLHHRRFVHHPV